MMAMEKPEHQQDRAEHHDDADFDQRGDVLQIGTFARAPDVDGSHDGDHQHQDERRLQRGRVE